MIWLNGDFVETARIDPADRGFLLGDGAFETIYVENGRCGFLREHKRRLAVGLETMRIAAPEGLARLDRIVAGLAKRMDLSGPAAVRVTVTRGVTERGLAFREAAPTMIATLVPVGSPVKRPLRLHLSSRTRFAGATTSTFKAIGGYIENLLAHNEAREAGADEAVMLNEEGRVVCAAAANIFLVKGETLITPSLREGALPGVVRGLLLKGANEIGLSVEERPILVVEVAQGEIVLTNSLIGVRSAVMAGLPSRKKSARVVTALQSWYEERLRSDIEKRRTR
ncbi:MAG: aminotransferase class IV [Amphiplicatus sp.]